MNHKKGTLLFSKVPFLTLNRSIGLNQLGPMTFAL